MTRLLCSRRGFTLLEVLISSTLAAAVLAAALSTFVFLGRNLTRLANYQALEAEGRKALTWLQRDFSLAESVKSGATPDETSVTLVLPAGEVSYSYNNTALSLRRQASFGPNQDFTMLRNDHCSCTEFTFEYYTGAGGAPTSQITPGLSVPYSIKQLRFRFIIRTPDSHNAATRTSYEVVSAHFLLRNRRAPDGN